MTRALGIALAAIAIAAAPRPARADNITVGVYAPSAPFPGTPARVDFATRLARHLGSALGGQGIGRVYGRARDFGAAVRKGNLELAVVDPAYLAAAGGKYEVLAVGVRGGATETSWRLVARGGARRVLDLRGRSLLVPVGGRADDFVLHAMFGGELPGDFFSRIRAAPDALSAVAAVGLGKADAAVVPSGIDLPDGVAQVAELESFSGPVLVAFPGLSERRRERAARAATSFKAQAAIEGFRAAEKRDTVVKLARRLAAPKRRGPMAVPNIRIAADELLGGRRFEIDHADPRRFAIAPPPPGGETTEERATARPDRNEKPEPDEKQSDKGEKADENEKDEKGAARAAPSSGDGKPAERR
jgi:hypothetical protein